ncbi:MAG: hypothetical protein KDE63_07260 [Novosphingobium sp.]|nr:hypothetical protein [Novosphingobium sp.]
MKRKYLILGAVIGLSSSFVLAQDAPESLLPPGFGDPAPAPAPAPATKPPSSSSSRPSSTQAPRPVIQPLPGMSAPEISGVPSGSAAFSLPDDFPSIAEIEAMTTDEIDELLGLKPKFDIPPAARRKLDSVGIINSREGGFPSRMLAGQPASLVRAALAGNKGPLVSRWGHILLRRALATRFDAPQGMNPVEFAALRAALLNRLGESVPARALVQDVDTANYNDALTKAAIDSYIATGDILGTCPAVRLQGGAREGAQWDMLRAICGAYAGEGTSADRTLNKMLRQGKVAKIDVLLAQRFAGAAGKTRRTVNIEWDEVEKITPWRYALASALGIEVPQSLLKGASPYYRKAASTAPMLPLPDRAWGASLAAERGILSSAALVDLYSQIYSDSEIEGSLSGIASDLRDSFVAETPAARLSAMQQVWGAEKTAPYAMQVMTARAAARIPPSDDFADSAGAIIASMLTAGLDHGAMRWKGIVADGSQGWALLALAEPKTNARASTGALDSFIDDDDSVEQRKSRFLVAGLAGLGRLSEADTANAAKRLNVDFARQTRWSRMIDRAADVRNPALVALLAGVGMQGKSWDKMTARHLFHIVGALHRVGLDAEARMIAAEAVARG